ncbi:MAG: hypothetical protein ACRDP9_23980 [Kribbellaceae bacterium]
MTNGDAEPPGDPGSPNGGNQPNGKKEKVRYGRPPWREHALTRADELQALADRFEAEAAHRRETPEPGNEEEPEEGAVESAFDPYARTDITWNSRFAIT